MTKPQQPNSRNSPKKKIAKTKTSISPKDISFTDEHTNDRKANSHSHQQITTSNDKSNRNARVANAISAIALVVSIALAWYTYQVFKLASSQKDSVKKSADASLLSAQTAQNTLAETKRYNSSYLKSQTDAFNEAKRYNNRSLMMQQKSIESNNKDSRERFMRDTTALELQIKGLRQSQEQFTKQYEPYLKLNVDSIIVRFNKLYVYYTMFNLTNTPVKVVSIKSTAYVRGTESILSLKMPNASNEALYIIKETPQPRFFTIPEATPDEIKYVVSGAWSIYWDVEFEYINQITDQKRRYIVSVKLNKARGENPPYPTFKRNDNFSF